MLEQPRARRITSYGGNTIQQRKNFMKRFLFVGFAACTFALAPTLSASAMPGTHPNTLTGTDNSIIQARGGHRHGWGHRGGRRHHYGWGRGHHYGGWRGRGHHYGWRHHHWR